MVKYKYRDRIFSRRWYLGSGAEIMFRQLQGMIGQATGCSESRIGLWIPVNLARPRPGLMIQLMGLIRLLVES